MQIPKDIKGKNKLRDMRICLEYIKGKKPEQIKQDCQLKLSIRRIYTIIYDNAQFINPRIAWPKSKRIQMLQNWLRDKPNTRKDSADILEQLRKEVEGDKPLVEQHTHYTIKWRGDEEMPKLRGRIAQKSVVWKEEADRKQ